MIKIIIITIVVLALLGITYACTPIKKTTSPQTTTQKLMGEWTMYKEICCGRRSVERTGNDMKKPKSLNFTKPENVAIVDLKTKATTTINFKLEKEDRGNGNMIEYIRLGDQRRGIIRFEGETLIIDYSFMDLQKEFYKKK